MNYIATIDIKYETNIILIFICCFIFYLWMLDPSIYISMYKSWDISKLIKVYLFHEEITF